MSIGYTHLSDNFILSLFRLAVMVRSAILFLVLSSCFQAKAQFNPTEIDIIRDQWGVPHIDSPTDAQTTYGLAWAHAEDDFETIQQIMLAAKQMMGRYKGKEGAPIDYVVGLIRCQDIVNKHRSAISPDFMMIVEAYASGLNAYARHHPNEVLLKKSFPLSTNDILKAYVLQLAVQDGADRLIQNLFNNIVDSAELETKGSNAFAISRAKTTDGNTYLAVNSHQPLEGPAAWYEAHLKSDEGWNMLGGLFPGGPVIFHGTNEYLGWAHTVNYFDKIDVFQLEMHPTQKNRYRFDDQWLSLEKRKVKLRIKVFGGLVLPITKEALHSVYGPVVKNEKGFFSFKMAIFDDIRAIEQWYKMNKSQNLQEFKAALSMTAIPSFNIIYADKYDSIFYIGNGKIPHRNAAYDWRSTLPGNTSQTLSTSYHPMDDLPMLTNPSSGYLFNTNNTAFNASSIQDNLSIEDYDPTMGYRAFENNRSMRFMELIAAHDKLSWDDFLAIKYDATLPDSLMYAINLNPIFELEPSDLDSASQIIEIIQDWNKSARAEEIGPAQLHLVYRKLNQDIEEINPKSITREQFMSAANFASWYLIKHFGKLDVTLGEYQKLTRGKKELPLGGIPDVIAAMHSTPIEDGKIRGRSGESYIMMIRYPKEGFPIIETVNAYGASNKVGSPHYDDQMDLFINRERKPMTLDMEEVRRTAKRIYHPK